jgi:hypothetical protein
MQKKAGGYSIIEIEVKETKSERKVKGNKQIETRSKD